MDRIMQSTQSVLKERVMRQALVRYPSTWSG